MQRYNQGFGGFGPLEKCSTGKLVKFEDADEYVRKLEHRYDQIIEAKEDRIKKLSVLLEAEEAISDSLHDEIDALKSHIEARRNQANELNDNIKDVKLINIKLHGHIRQYREKISIIGTLFIGIPWILFIIKCVSTWLTIV